MKSNRTVLVAVCLAAVVVCAAVLITQSRAQRQARQKAITAHHAAVTRCQELGAQMNGRIQAARESGITRAEFTEQFGEISACSPQTQTEVPPAATHMFTDERSHRVFYLRFDGDVLAGVSSSHGPDDIQRHLPSVEQRTADME